MSFEEDTYSRIFAALKHPVRRKILSILGEERLTYTELLNRLGVETGFLNYHLENLSELIAKDSDGKYHLSEFGVAARSLTYGVEAPVRKRASSLSVFGRRVESRTIFIGIAIILVLTNSVFAYSAYSQSAVRADAIDSTLAQSRVLVIESINELNRTVTRADLGYVDLPTLHDDLLKLAEQCRYLSKIDGANSGSWLMMGDAFDYVSGMAFQLNDQWYLKTMRNESTQMSWLGAESLGKIRDDLGDMLVAFPSSGGSDLPSSVVSTAADYSVKLASDTRYAKSVFNLGDLIDGSSGWLVEVGNEPSLFVP